MKQQTDENKKEKKKAFGRLQMSLLLLFIAIAAVVAATAAWISIADNGRIQSMNMEITSGISMRFDLDPHAEFTDYVQTLNFNQISARINQDYGFDMTAVPLEPVTSTDAATFSLENGTNVANTEGKYLTFTLHFMAMKDMTVHLTTESASGQEGTLITSSVANLPSAMRISFLADGITYIYDPGMGDMSITEGTVKTFGLADGEDMNYNDNNAMFSLEEGVDKTVLVHVWLEGSDQLCDDTLKGADYSIALRFQGTDVDNVPLNEDGYYSETTNSNSSEEPTTKYTQRDQTADEQTDDGDLTFWERWQQFWDRLLND